MQIYLTSDINQHLALFCWPCLAASYHTSRHYWDPERMKNIALKDIHRKRYQQLIPLPQNDPGVKPREQPMPADSFPQAVDVLTTT